MFSFKPKTETITGCFVKTPCCTECDWFSQPLLLQANGFFPVPRVVCPDCGGVVNEIVGKYIIESTTSIFGNSNEYVGFIKKQLK